MSEAMALPYLELFFLTKFFDQDFACAMMAGVGLARPCCLARALARRLTILPEKRRTMARIGAKASCSALLTMNFVPLYL